MSVFLAVGQIRSSIPALAELNPFFGMSFLAFKEAAIPIGEARPIIFSQIAQRVMDKHYKPALSYPGFYSPFKTPNKAKRWMAKRYASTSLQRVTADTFADALIHTKGQSSWGWRRDYIEKLQAHLGGRSIPAFHLAVWLFRNHEWPIDASPEDVVEKLIIECRLTRPERVALFDESLPDVEPGWTSSAPIAESDLLAVIGNPPGWAPPAGAALRSIEIHEVGPAKRLRYEPAERLNIITGNNSLGKTFLLDCLWWALTGDWLEHAAMPRRNVRKSQPHITYSLTSHAGKPQDSSASYNWDRQVWAVKPATRRLPGLVIYARFDGSFAIWDPARSQLADQSSRSSAGGRIFLKREQVWDGTREDANGGKERWMCNGLLRDWISWQTGGERYEQQFSAFVSSLTALSPSESEQLQPGEPERLALDSRLYPTLRMPYGDVPLIYTSAAVQRIVALAYALVWAWQEHCVSSLIIRKEPQRHMVLIVDEVEAHLHPMWQRLIVPAIMKVTASLSSSVKAQLHIATHSPMVLASTETVFEENHDELHHLRLEQGNVVLEELPFIKRGRADLWLVSDAFGLGQARSLPAERAIEEAKALQLAPNPAPAEVDNVNARLVSVLAADDEFWPRWRYFFQQRGTGL